MKLLNFLFSFLFFVISCGPENSTRPPIIKTPKSSKIEFTIQKSIVFHSDITFTSDEQRMLNEVAGYVYLQSSGILNVSYVYDLDVSKVEISKISNSIIRTTSNSELIKSLDINDLLIYGCTFLGPKNVYLVSDRLSSTIIFKHVAFHEILHAFQMTHVDDEEAIMYHKINQSLCINKTDAQELCKIYDCTYDKLNYCE